MKKENEIHNRQAWESENERERALKGDVCACVYVCVSTSSISFLLQVIANYGVRLYVKEGIEGE